MNQMKKEVENLSEHAVEIKGSCVSPTKKEVEFLCKLTDEIKTVLVSLMTK